jgi:hypothetical protein
MDRLARWNARESSLLALPPRLLPLVLIAAYLLYCYWHFYCDIPTHSPHTRDTLASLTSPSLSAQPTLVVDTTPSQHTRGLTPPPTHRALHAEHSLYYHSLNVRLASHVRLTACSPSESHAPTVPGGSSSTRRRRALHRRTSTSGRGKRTTAAKRPCSRNRRITAASSARKDM